MTQISPQGTPRAQVRVAVLEGFGRRDATADLEPVRGFSSFLKKKISIFLAGRHAVAGVPRAYPSAPGPIWDPLTASHGTWPSAS